MEGREYKNREEDFRKFLNIKASKPVYKEHKRPFYARKSWAEEWFMGTHRSIDVFLPGGQRIRKKGGGFGHYGHHMVSLFCSVVNAFLRGILLTNSFEKKKKKNVEYRAMGDTMHFTM